MAKRVEMRWKRGAFAEIRTLPGVSAEVTKVAQRMGSAAGSDYTVNDARPTGGRVRARASVVAGSIKARRDNARNGTLTRVLGSRGR